jgi:hypothetical protein
MTSKRIQRTDLEEILAAGDHLSKSNLDTVRQGVRAVVATNPLYEKFLKIYHAIFPEQNVSTTSFFRFYFGGNLEASCAFTIVQWLLKYLDSPSPSLSPSLSIPDAHPLSPIFQRKRHASIVPSPALLLTPYVCLVKNMRNNTCAAGTLLGGPNRRLILSHHFFNDEEEKADTLTIEYSGQTYVIDPKFVFISRRADITIIDIDNDEFPVVEDLDIVSTKFEAIIGQEVVYAAFHLDTISYHTGVICSIIKDAIPIISIVGPSRPGYSGAPVCLVMRFDETRPESAFPVLLSILVAQSAKIPRHSLSRDQHLYSVFDFVRDNMSTGIALSVPFHDAIQYTGDVTQESILENFHQLKSRSVTPQSSKSESWHAALSESKWSSLSPYLQDYNNDDISNLTVTELLRIVEPKERMLMTLFIKSYLKSIVSKENEKEKEDKSVLIKEYEKEKEDIENHEKRPLEPSKPQFTLVDGRLEPRVGSVRFKDATDNTEATTADLARWASELDATQQNSVHTLDLSSLGLLDDDISNILKLLQVFPKCKVLDLSSNHIVGKGKPGLNVDQNVVALLLQCTVNLVANPIATIDRKDFFHSLELRDERDQLFSHFIWIPEAYLDRGNWKVLLRQEDVKVLTQQTHEVFYKKK